ncbi:PilX N-terminal domain-containing pilus assembly protein [Neisseria dentiae]|uniref:pilus assembly PilX family protein n=1 Tax=Neisseria dentiae TaxID=194197 RepID=UPI0035A0BC57
MRQPQPFITSTSKSAQQGFSLFIVLMVMIVVAFLVVSVTQSYNTEQRISTNDADHKYATALAETALRTGESRIATAEFENRVTFSPDCTDALCSPANAAAGTFGDIVVQAEASKVDAWERKTCGNNNSSCLDANGRAVTVAGARTNPRYIIEYISTQADGTVIYRVTAKAWGKNNNTVVILQSYVAAS